MPRPKQECNLEYIDLQLIDHQTNDRLTFRDPLTLRPLSNFLPLIVQDVLSIIIDKSYTHEMILLHFHADLCDSLRWVYFDFLNQRFLACFDAFIERSLIALVPF